MDRKPKKIYYGKQQQPKPTPIKEVSQGQDYIDLTSSSSSESHESDSAVISNDYVIGSGGGYLEDEIFNILAAFKVKFATFHRTYGDDAGFNHVNESHDIYQEAIDGILKLFEFNYMCSE